MPRQKRKSSCLSKQNFCRAATYEPRKKSSQQLHHQKSETGTFFELLNFFPLNICLILKMEKFKSSKVHKKFLKSSCCTFFPFLFWNFFRFVSPKLFGFPAFSRHFQLIKRMVNLPFPGTGTTLHFHSWGIWFVLSSYHLN